jgi:hypothetical protein
VSIIDVHLNVVCLVAYVGDHGLSLEGLMRRCLALFAFLLLVACTDDTPRGGTAVVRDSAGVRIVEHPADYSAPTWHISDAPSLDIGAVSGDSSTLLYQVEGAHRLSDGRIVVANRSTHELRYYDGSGQYLFATGREGEGPGEFGYLTWTASCGGDSIFAYDIATRRFSVFAEDGRFARSVLLQLPGGVTPYGAATCAPDGTFLFAGWPVFSRDPGPSRPSRPLALIASDGTALTSFGEFPGGERYTYVSDGRVTGGGPRPLGRETFHVLGDGRFYLGTSDEYEIRVYSVTGELEMLIRGSGPDLAITKTHIDRFVSDQLSRATRDNQRRSWERQYRDMEFPKTFPAYSRLLLDKLGNLWVQDYLRPGDDKPVWDVFEPDGAQVATLNTPPGLHIYEIGVEYVLGKWQDELDVEHVQLYDLIKPGQ